MSEAIKVPSSLQPARNPLAWVSIFLLAGLAWIPTLQQTLGMLAMPMYGTMGMKLSPFLWFWTVMMAAMMLPALAPTVSIRLTAMRRQTTHPVGLLIQLGAFLLGYLLIWSGFGIPIFVFCLAIEHFVLSTPLLALGLGIALFVSAGLYQFTPQKKRALLHCNPALYSQSKCLITTPAASLRAQLGEGLQHGLACLQCCGVLMLVLVAVGLMNLFWMVLIMLIIFIEKVWVHGHRLSILFGFALIFYGLLTFAVPGLLPGL